MPCCLVSDDGGQAAMPADYAGRIQDPASSPGQPANCGGRRATERPFGRSTGGHASDRTGAPIRRECAQLKSRADHAA